MPIRAVFFDAGDTLIHRWTLKADRPAWLCDQAGVPLPQDPAARRAAAQAYERFFQDRRRHLDAWSTEWYLRMNTGALMAAGLTENVERYAKQVLAHSSQLPKTEVVDPEAIPMLEALRARGYRLAIVSNWDGTLLDHMRPTGLAGYFDAILDSAVVGSFKPDTRIFEIACAATGVKPEEAVHVGDSPGADVAGALAAGVRPILLDALQLFTEGFYDLPRFDRVTRLSELPDLLDAWR